MPAFTQTDCPGGCHQRQWALTTADPTGTAVEIPGAADRSIVFTGTWGGATAALEGSADGTTFLPLTDPQGNAISKTADALEAVLENVRYIRARLSVVGAGATVTATLLSRSTR